MRWNIHGERVIYDSEWVRLSVADVELPGSRRIDHHVIRSTKTAAGVVVHDPSLGVLLLWRHRFITDTWGWEIPAGAVDDGEFPSAAAEREVLEETGWRPAAVEPLAVYHPSNGISDQQFHLFHAAGATRVGDPRDVEEAERVEWVPVDAARELVRRGHVTDGLTLTALLYAWTFDLM